MVADLRAGGLSSSPTNLVDVGGTLFFAASADNGAGRELWTSDGLPGGSTRMVRDINPGSASSIGIIAAPVDVNGTLFFWADDGVNGFELWKSDGTAAGTELVKDINATAPGASSVGFDPNPSVIIGSRTHRFFNPLAIDGTYYFRADDGIHGIELWKSDGTTAGTSLIKDINPSSAASSQPMWLTEVDGALFFIADDGVTGPELWKSDGTNQGTQRVADIRSGPWGSRDEGHDQLVAIDGSVYFSANDGVNGTALWRSDGSEAGTWMVADLHPGNDGLAPVNKLTHVGNGLFFAADDGESGVELWYSDGSEFGTRLASDIYQGPEDSIALITGPVPHDLVASGGRLFVPAWDGVHGPELWATAASAEGFEPTRTRPLDGPPPDPQSGPDISVRLITNRFHIDSDELFIIGARVINHGPGTAFGVWLNSQIAAGGGHFDSTEICIPPTNPDVPPAQVICFMGHLPEGRVQTASFIARAPTVAANTRIRISESVGHGGLDPNLSNNFSFGPVMVVPPPPPPSDGVDLEVFLIDRIDPVLPGGGIHYHVGVVNHGPEQASGVTLINQLPPETSFQSVTSAPEGICSEAGGTVTCLLGAMAMDAVANIGIVASAPPALGRVRNVATVSADQVDLDEANSMAEEFTTINETLFIFNSRFESN